MAKVRHPKSVSHKYCPTYSQAFQMAWPRFMQQQQTWIRLHDWTKCLFMHFPSLQRRDEVSASSIWDPGLLAATHYWHSCHRNSRSHATASFSQLTSRDHGLHVHMRGRDAIPPSILKMSSVSPDASSHRVWSGVINAVGSTVIQGDTTAGRDVINLSKFLSHGILISVLFRISSGVQSLCK